jgi:hypothetical protein
MRRHGFLVNFGPEATDRLHVCKFDSEPARPADAWIAKQNAPMTRPEAIRAMLDAVSVIVAKDPGEKPVKKAKGK